MKIVPTLGGLLPLLMFAACGGEAPKTSTSAPASSSSDSQSSNPSSQDGVPAKSAKPAAKQKPKKRVRRPRINVPVVKALLGQDPAGPAAPVESTAKLVALGKALYHSEHLSQKGNLSCASCHNLSTYGVDNLPTSPGSTGENGERNTPTVYNAARQFRQFWDGRAESVEDQAIMPVLNPIEHGLADEAAVVAKINEKPELVAGFKEAFPEDASPVSAKNFGVAIGAFERTLVTRSRWDDYLDGNLKALTNEELHGLKTFMDVGCTQCHMTRLLGGHAYQKLGLRKPYTGKDTGRMQVTNSVADKYSFKIPTLSNIAKTAPYYHDGSVATLEEAVKTMAVRQLDKELKDEEVAKIVTFLKALTGPLPEEYAKK
jgi:cytochrome c peroxidase